MTLPAVSGTYPLASVHGRAQNRPRQALSRWWGSMEFVRGGISRPGVRHCRRPVPAVLAAAVAMVFLGSVVACGHGSGVSGLPSPSVGGANTAELVGGDSVQAPSASPHGPSTSASRGLAALPADTSAAVPGPSASCSGTSPSPAPTSPVPTSPVPTSPAPTSPAPASPAPATSPDCSSLPASSGP